MFTLCTVPWFLWRIQPHFFAPIYITSLLLMLTYPVRALMVLLFPDTTVSISPQHYVPAELSLRPQLVTTALSYCLIGVAAYVAFYYLIPFEKYFSRQAVATTRINHWPLRILLIYGMGWIARYYQISTENYSSWFPGEGYDPKSGTILSYFADFCEISYILVWVYWVQRERGSITAWILLIPITVTEVMFALTMQGTKFGLVRLTVFPLMACSLIRGGIPWKTLGIGFCAVVYLVFPFIQTYRDTYRELFGGSIVSPQQGLFLAVEAFPSMYDQPSHYTANVSIDAPVFLLGAVIFLNRFNGFDSVLVMLEHVPVLFDFTYGADFFLAPLALIPRAIWPEKPLTEGLRVYDREILGTSFGTATSPYAVAEGYLNGDLLGILFVMLTLASMQKLLFVLFRIWRKDNGVSLVAYIWFFFWVVNIDNWILPAYAFMSQRAIMFSIVIFLLTWKLPCHKKTQDGFQLSNELRLTT